jgi:septal ring factor EnvC (AmiA/AmiB activator)
MNNLIFYAILIALIYYFFYYLPQQKKINPILTQSQFTQTDPHPIQMKEPGPLQKNNQELDKLKQQIKVKDKEKQELEKDYQTRIKDKEKQVTNLQSEIRDLAKRPVKPNQDKATQTDELTNALDTLIKDIQNLNNSL